MTNEVKISKISIEIGKKTIELSIEEAKELKSALDGIFEKAIEVKVVEKIETIPYPYPVYPHYITWCDTPVRYGKTEITCDVSKQTLTCCVSDSKNSYRSSESIR